MASFLSTLGGLVSPGLTVATSAAAANQEGAAMGAAAQHKSMMEQLAALRQRNKDEQEQALNAAQIGNINSQITERAAPKFETATPGSSIFDKATGQITTPGKKVVRRQDVQLDMGGQPVAGSYDPEEDAYYYKGQKVDNPKKYNSPDQMVRFFEGQRIENDQRQAAEWQRHYDRLVTPKMTKYGTVEEGTGLPPAEAAAKADEIYGSHPRLAPNIRPRTP